MVFLVFHRNAIFQNFGGFSFVCVVNGQMVLTFKMRLHPTGLAELTKKGTTREEEKSRFARSHAQRLLSTFTDK